MVGLLNYIFTEHLKGIIKMLRKEPVKHKGCKFCKAPFESLVKEEKTVKLYGNDGKLIKPEKGKKFVAMVTKCTECDTIVRFGFMREVEV